MTDSTDFMGFVPGSGGKYETLPEGTYDFVIHGIVGLGLRPQSYEGKPKEPAAEIKVIFEIPEEKREDGQTELLSIRFKISNSEKSHYYKFCSAVLGESAVKVEENMKRLCTATGMKELLGKVGSLSVATWENGENRSVSNKGFFPLHPKVEKPVPTREFVFFNPFAPDIKVFKENLTTYTRKQIMEAVNADSFSDELKKAYAESQVEDAKKKEGTGDKTSPVKDEGTTAPWEGSTEAIQ